MEKEAGKTTKEQGEDTGRQAKKKRKAEKEDAERHEKKIKDQEGLAIVATDQPTSIIKKQVGEKPAEDEGSEVEKKLADAEKNMKINSTTHRKMWMKFLRFRKNKKRCDSALPKWWLPCSLRPGMLSTTHII